MGRWPSFVVVIVLLIFGAGTAAAAEEATAEHSAHSKAFPLLASTYVTLNALDVYTTTRALQSGGSEVNPIVGPFAAHPVAFGALKAASTTATILAARRIWKRHPAAAIVLLIGANAGMSFVVVHNAGVMKH